LQTGGAETAVTGDRTTRDDWEDDHTKRVGGRKKRRGRWRGEKKNLNFRTKKEAPEKPCKTIRRSKPQWQ